MEYIDLLHVSIAGLTYITSPLREFMSYGCVCQLELSTNDAATLTSIIDNIDGAVTKLPTSVYDKVMDANRKANTVFAKIPKSQEPAIIVSIDHLVAFFNKLITISDSYVVIFPKVTQCSDLHSRIGFMRFKQYKFNDIIKVCNTNLTKFSSLYGNFSEAAASAKLDHDRSVAVNVFSDWAKHVQAVIQFYLKKLQEALTTLLNALNNVEKWPDAYCRVTDKAVAVKRSFNVTFEADFMNPKFACGENLSVV